MTRRFLFEQQQQRQETFSMDTKAIYTYIMFMYVANCYPGETANVQLLIFSSKQELSMKITKISFFLSLHPFVLLTILLAIFLSSIRISWNSSAIQIYVESIVNEEKSEKNQRKTNRMLIWLWREREFIFSDSK